MYDSIEINVRSLKTLDISSKHYGPILVSIIMSKLPSEIRLVISRSMATLTAATANDKWKIDQLLEYVKAELKSRELCNFVANPNEEPRLRCGLQNGDYSASSLLTGASRIQESKNPRCFCDDNTQHIYKQLGQKNSKW